MAGPIGKQALAVQSGDGSDRTLALQAGAGQGCTIGPSKPAAPAPLSKADEHGEIVILAEQARELFGFGGPRADTLGPTAAEELHMTPVRLCGFAPIVEGLVGACRVGRPERAPCLAVVLLEPSGYVPEGKPLEPFAGKQRLRAL